MRPRLLRRNISQDAAAGSPVYNLARKGGGMQHVSLQESRRKAPMLHVDPRAFCSHLGLSLLGLEDILPPHPYPARASDSVRTRRSFALAQASVHKLPANHSSLHRGGDAGSSGKEYRDESFGEGIP